MSEPVPSGSEPAPSGSEPAPDASQAPDTGGSGAPVESTAPAVTLPPGSPAADPDVQAARAAVQAARGSFQRELTTLQAKGKETIDIKARIRRLPSDVKRDPRKYAAIAAASAGTIAAFTALRRRGRKSIPSGTLPGEVEAVLAGLGDDGRKVRAALDSSFARYLSSHGVPSPSRRRLPPGALTIAMPVIAAAIREGIVRAAARRKSESAQTGAPVAAPAASDQSKGE
jgi:hypothetical protein